jgi:hypothetical protein
MALMEYATIARIRSQRILGQNRPMLADVAHAVHMPARPTMTDRLSSP